MKLFEFQKSKMASHCAIGTIIGSEAALKGEISSKGPIRFDGLMDGNIFSESEIFIGEKSSIKGNVVGKKVIIAGEIKGDITSMEAVEIKKNGKIFGNIICNSLSVDEGASYKGKVTMGQAKEFAEDKSGDLLSEKTKELIGL